MAAANHAENEPSLVIRAEKSTPLESNRVPASVSAPPHVPPHGISSSVDADKTKLCNCAILHVLVARGGFCLTSNSPDSATRKRSER